MSSSPVLLISCFWLLLISGFPAAHDRVTTKVTWDREIAPIVRARCVTCHSPGGRGPMPLTTYEEARPWAKAIKEEVLARRMPKWPIVRGYGDFTNDPSLAAFEIALVAAWADGGAPASAKTSAPAGASAATVPSASTQATADTPKNTPVTSSPRTRKVSLACSARTLPTGRLVGLVLALERGQSLRMMLVRGDGAEEPLLWVRDFDPAFAETYWLRNPVRITRPMRLRAEAPTPCTFTALLESGTGK